MKINKISYKKFYIVLSGTLMFLSFFQIVLFPLIRPTFKFIFLKPIPFERLDDWLNKICKKEIVKESDENSLIKYICSNKNLFIKNLKK